MSEADPTPPVTPEESLRSAILAEQAGIAEFVACLEAEQRALRDAKADTLPALTERKSVAAQRLNTLSVNRNQTLAAAGFAPDRAGLAAAAADAALAGDIQALLDYAAQAAELNRVNGRLIALQLQTTRDALDALGLGHQPATGNGRLYDTDARHLDTGPRTGVRIIDSA